MAVIKILINKIKELKMTYKERKEMLQEVIDLYDLETRSRSTYGTMDTTELFYKGHAVAELSGYAVNRAGFACLSCYDWVEVKSDEEFLEMIEEIHAEVKKVDETILKSLMRIQEATGKIKNYKQLALNIREHPSFKEGKEYGFYINGRFFPYSPEAIDDNLIALQEVCNALNTKR